MLETFHHLIGEDAGHIAWWQMTNRAIIIFAYALIIYRVAPRRSFAQLSAADIVLTVILGSSLSRALTGNAPVLPTLAATAVLVGLHAGLALLAPRSRLVSRVVKGRSVTLVKDGRPDWPAIRRLHLGEHDLMEHLRLNGLKSMEQVEEAHIERNGRISIIKKA